MASRSDIMAGRAFVELYVKKDALTNGLNAARRQLQNFGQSMSQLGAGLLKIGTTAALPFGLSVRTFAAFDDQMRAVKAAVNANEIEFRRLTEVAKELGLTSGFTATQVGELMLELGRAGFNPKQIEDMTESVLQLSRATGTNAATSAGIMSAAIRQFGLHATDAARVADSLTAAANMSFSSVESLGEALSYAGPVANDFGMQIEDVLAIMGTLGNIGIQGSEAGTTIRRLLTLTAAEASKMSSLFGVAFQDAKGNARPLIDILDDVNNATKGLGTATRAAKFNEAFGILGITGASALGKAAGSARQLATDIRAAGGIAQKTAKEMDSGPGGALRRLTGSVGGVAIAIGEALAPSLTIMMNNLTSAADVVAKFIKENQGLVVTISRVVTGVIAAGAAFVAIGSTLFGLGSILGMISSGITFFGALISGFAGLVAAITPVAVAVGVIGAALYYGLTAWAKYTATGAATMTTLGGVVATVVGQVREAFNSLVATAMPFVDVFQKAIAGITDALAAGDIGTAAAIAMNSVVLAFEMGKSLIVGIWLDVKETMIGVWESLVERVIGVWNSLVNHIMAAWGTIVTEASAACAFIGSLFTSTVNLLLESDFGKALASGWEVFKIGAVAAFEYVLSATRTLITAIDLVRTGIGQMIDDVVKIESARVKLAVGPALNALNAANASGEGAGELAFGGLLDKANQAAQETRQRVGGEQEKNRQERQGEQEQGKKDRELQRDGKGQERQTADEQLRQAGKDRIAELKAEQARLVALAKTNREELDKKREEDKKKAGPAAGGKDGADAKGMLETKSLGATFSAAAAIAMGRGGAAANPQERVAKAAEKQVKVSDDIRAFVGKNNELLKQYQKVFDDIERNTKKTVAKAGK